MHWILPALAGACGLGVGLADRLDARWVRDAFVWMAAHTVFVAVCRAWRSPGWTWSAALLASAATGAIGVAALERGAQPAVERPGSAIVEATLASGSGSGGFARRGLRHVRRVAPLPWDAEPVGRLPERLELDLEPAHPLAREAPGTRIRAALRVRPTPRARNPGGRDAATVARRNGVGGRAALVHSSLARVSAPARGPGAALWRWRQRTAASLVRAGEGGALLAALALGWRGHLPDEAREAFRVLGLSHLLAVSGLHLALVGGAAFALAHRILRCRGAAQADPRRVALAAALAAAAAYALLTGTPVSVRRAFAMLAVPAIAAWARRPIALPALFGGAALGILWADPTALFAPGAQLSFAATAALGVGLGRGPREPGDATSRGVGLLRTALHASAAAVLGTAPIGAAHFGTAVGVGWLANVLAVPWTGFVLLPSALVAVIALSVLGARADAFVTLASVPAAWLLEAAVRLAPEAPYATGLTPSAGALAVAVGVAVLVLRTRRFVPIVVAAFAVPAWLACAPPAAWGPPLPRVVFLDVGQGDASVLQASGGAVLVDAGTRIPQGFDAGARVVVPALRALGIDRLALAVASHADLDHRGGLEAVLAQLHVDRLWVPCGGLRDPAFAPLIALAEQRGTLVEAVSSGRRESGIPGLRIEVLWPPASDAWVGNDGSVVLRVQAGDARILLPGDLEATGEAALLRSGADLRAELLKLAHHGSRSSTTTAFLEAVSPRLAVVSAARFSRWGMPHAEVTERLADCGIDWRWPARDGAVAIPLAPRPSGLGPVPSPRVGRGACRDGRSDASDER